MRVMSEKTNHKDQTSKHYTKYKLQKANFENLKHL